MKRFTRRLLSATVAIALFFISHPAVAGPLDPYIAKAKEEGSVVLGLSIRQKRFGKTAGAKYLEAFQKRYPFLKIDFKRIGGPRERERVLSEMTAGAANFDVATVSETMVGTVMNAKLARIVNWKALGVPDFLTHPKNAGVSLRTPVYGIAYNRELVPDDVARAFTWESCTDPRWKGKTVMEARPRHLNQFYQADSWGQEKTLAYAKRWVANEPIVEASRSTGAQKLAAGAYHIYCGMARKNVMEMKVFAEVDSVGIVFPEPVPIGIGDLIYVADKGKHPNAGILFLAWSATQEAQNLLDNADFTGHPAFEGNDVAAVLKGRKVVYGSWDYTDRADDILAEILQAMGFPVVR